MNKGEITAANSIIIHVFNSYVISLGSVKLRILNYIFKP
jgi:hypothetical protein